ncbi:MAG: hypothetical protein ACJ8BW_36070 [Ktedonobacteraceae bacterium]
MAADKLTRLIARCNALNAQIRQAQNKENAAKRKIDTSRKFLAGAAVLDEADKHPEYKAQLYNLLNRFLSKPDDSGKCPGK